MKKSHWVKSSEDDGYYSTSTCILTLNHFTENAIWEGALAS